MIKLLNLLMVLLFTAAGLRAEDPVKVAVMDLKARSGIDNMTVSSLTDFVCTTILNAGEYDVIGKDDMQTMMEHIADRQLLDCDDTKCLAKIGGALGVQLLVSGNIGMVGKMYLINIKLIDIEDALVRNRISEKYLGDETGLVAKVEESVAKLFGTGTDDTMVESAVAEPEPVQEAVPAAKSAPPVAVAETVEPPAEELKRLSWTVMAGLSVGEAVVDETFYDDLHQQDGEDYSHGTLPGAYVGSRMNVAFSPKLGLVVEAGFAQKNYSEESTRLNIIHVNATDTEIEEIKTKVSYYLSYLELMVAPRFTLGPAHLLAGLSFGVLGDAWSEGERTIAGPASNYAEVTESVDGDQNDLRSGGALGIVLGGGVTFRKIIGELRINLGVTDIISDDNAVSLDGSWQSIRMIAVNLLVGYNF